MGVMLLTLLILLMPMAVLPPLVLAAINYATAVPRDAATAGDRRRDGR